MGTVTDITSMKKKPSHVKRVVRKIFSPYVILIAGLYAFVNDAVNHNWVGWHLYLLALIFWGSYAFGTIAYELLKWPKE